MIVSHFVCAIAISFSKQRWRWWMKKYFLIELIKRITRISCKDWRTTKVQLSKVKSSMWNHFNEKETKTHVSKIMFQLLFDEIDYSSKLFLSCAWMHFHNLCFQFIQKYKTVCFNSTECYSFVKNFWTFFCKFFFASRSFNHSCFNRFFSLIYAFSITLKSDKFADQLIFLMFFFLRFSSHCFETLTCVDALSSINYICLSKCFFCVFS